MDKFIDIVKVIVIGIVEGISEWLPISSTGHMIILDKWFNISTKFGQEYWSFFLVVIQLGAILAVVVTFFKQLWPFSKSKTDEEKKSIYKTWLNIVIGCLPAAILGLFLDDILDKYLYNYITVAITLIVYGVFFVLLEYIFKRKQVGFKVNDIYSLSMKSALIIGLAQVLALIPGTSRSGVTILAGMLIGCSREVSTKYSFFLSIPVMLGASLLKGVKFAVSGETITSFEIILLVIGIVVAFVISLVSIKFLTNFVKNHSFTVFGYYRIALGILLIVLFVTVLKDNSTIASNFMSILNFIDYNNFARSLV